MLDLLLDLLLERKSNNIYLRVARSEQWRRPLTEAKRRANGTTYHFNLMEVVPVSHLQNKYYCFFTLLLN